MSGSTGKMDVWKQFLISPGRWMSGSPGKMDVWKHREDGCLEAPAPRSGRRAGIGRHHPSRFPVTEGRRGHACSRSGGPRSGRLRRGTRGIPGPTLTPRRPARPRGENTQRTPPESHRRALRATPSHASVRRDKSERCVRYLRASSSRSVALPAAAARIMVQQVDSEVGIGPPGSSADQMQVTGLARLVQSSKTLRGKQKGNSSLN